MMQRNLTGGPSGPGSPGGPGGPTTGGSVVGVGLSVGVIV